MFYSYRKWRTSKVAPAPVFAELVQDKEQKASANAIQEQHKT